jgi:hypothetical protein
VRLFYLNYENADRRAVVVVEAEALGLPRSLEEGTLSIELPLLGLAYDPKDDLFEVSLDGVDHMIPKPREIYIDDGVGGLMSIEIIDADGAKQINTLTRPIHDQSTQRYPAHPP